MVIGGRSIPGDVALTFLAAKRSSPLDELGRVFGHASNLTDRLVPVWLIWVIALLCAIGVPLGVLAALYLSLRPGGGRAVSGGVGRGSTAGTTRRRSGCRRSARDAAITASRS